MFSCSPGERGRAAISMINKGKSENNKELQKIWKMCLLLSPESGTRPWKAREPYQISNAGA